MLMIHCGVDLHFKGNACTSGNKQKQYANGTLKRILYYG